MTYLIGVDEAGRGPLAGPVVVAGIRMSATTSLKFKVKSGKVYGKIRDSKKLTPQQREEWFSFLTTHPRIEWMAAKVWPKVIDRINISRAANLGARRVCAKLGVESLALHTKRRTKLSAWILLDGGLQLPRHIPHETIIKGDEKIPVIAAASIIAKVVRDRTMRRLHKKFPQYRFDIHKGYATRMHRKLTRKFGYSPIHRRSFKVAKS